MPSSFTQHLLQANHLQQQDFQGWLLQPGMLFAANQFWWGAEGPRPRPHEGLDLCTFGNRRGELNSLGAGALIPTLFAGQVVAIFADFLGQSILVAHQQQGARRFYSIYAHVIAAPHLSIGVTVHQKQGMCSLPRNCNRLPGAPDARKRPAMCASAHEQAADKADGVPGERLQNWRILETLGKKNTVYKAFLPGAYKKFTCGQAILLKRRLCMRTWTEFLGNFKGAFSIGSM